MLAIQPRRRGQGDKELTPVGVGPGVGHAENASARVLQGRIDLVLELFAIDGGAAATRAGWVAALNHEVGDDAVEDGLVVVAAANQRGEVFARLGGVAGVELDGESTLRWLAWVLERLWYSGRLTIEVSRLIVVAIL